MATVPHLTSRATVRLAAALVPLTLLASCGDGGESKATWPPAPLVDDSTVAPQTPVTKPKKAPEIEAPQSQASESQAPAPQDGTPATAYIAFARAANSGDAPAFSDATLPTFRSDLDAWDATAFAAAAAAGELDLPESVEGVEVEVGAAFMQANDLDTSWLSQVAGVTNLPDLGEDDVAAAHITDGYRGKDVDIVILRDGTDWRVWLIEAS